MTLYGLTDENVSDRDPRWFKLYAELFRLISDYRLSYCRTALHTQTDGQKERANRVSSSWCDGEPLRLGYSLMRS